jgi:hypothetical protein
MRPERTVFKNSKVLLFDSSNDHLDGSGNLRLWLHDFVSVTEGRGTYMTVQKERITGKERVPTVEASSFLGPVFEQDAKLAWTDPTDVFDLHVHLNWICLAKSDARLCFDPQCNVGWLNLDGLFVHTHLILTRDIARCGIGPREVDNCMLFWVAALLQSSTTRVGADPTKLCQ